MLSTEMKSFVLTKKSKIALFVSLKIFCFCFSFHSSVMRRWKVDRQVSAAWPLSARVNLRLSGAVLWLYVIYCSSQIMKIPLFLKAI
jgi:hypothetical protein